MTTYQYVNESKKFWNHSYRIHLHEFDTDGIIINADNEQDAIDYAIDYAESQGWMGAFLGQKDIESMSEQELSEHISGGNHGLYLSSENVRIVQLD